LNAGCSGPAGERVRSGGAGNDKELDTMKRTLCAVLGLFTVAATHAPAQVPPSLEEAAVARAQFTTAIENREPVDRVLTIAPPVDEIFFFTDVRNLQGQTILHRWEYGGEVVSQVPFVVEGPRWRVFSKKSLKPDQTGEWSVTVLDETGWPLHTEVFLYQAGPARVQPPDSDTPSSGD
jgi:hypothetical protein